MFLFLLFTIASFSQTLLSGYQALYGKVTEDFCLRTERISGLYEKGLSKKILSLQECSSSEIYELICYLNQKVTGNFKNCFRTFSHGFQIGFDAKLFEESKNFVTFKEYLLSLKGEKRQEASKFFLYCPEPEEIEQQFHAFCALLKDLNPEEVEKELCSKQFFFDGNKRTAKWIKNALILKKYFSDIDFACFEKTPAEPILHWPKTFFDRAHLDPSKMQLEGEKDQLLFNACLKYAEEEILCRPIAQMSEEEIVQMLLTFGKKINGVSAPLRTTRYASPDPNKDPSAWKVFYEQSLIFPDLQTFVLEADEKLLRRIAFISCAPDEIEKALHIFAENLAFLFFIQAPPVVIASFAHEKLIEIHPFLNGNGRVARIFMNSILMQAGIRPIEQDGSFLDLHKTPIQAIERGKLKKHLELLKQKVETL